MSLNSVTKECVQIGRPFEETWSECVEGSGLGVAQTPINQKDGTYVLIPGSLNYTSNLAFGPIG
jgi:hypothetical protein